jgi:hypothetical protein
MAVQRANREATLTRRGEVQHPTSDLEMRLGVMVTGSSFVEFVHGWGVESRSMNGSLSASSVLCLVKNK